jgi:hypothetical protein
MPPAIALPVLPFAVKVVLAHTLPPNPNDMLIQQGHMVVSHHQDQVVEMDILGCLLICKDHDLGPIENQPSPHLYLLAASRCYN